MSSPITRKEAVGIFHAAPGLAIPCVDVNVRPAGIGHEEMLSISIEPQAVWVHHAAEDAIRIRILGERGRSPIHHHDMGVMVADRDPELSSLIATLSGKSSKRRNKMSLLVTRRGSSSRTCVVTVSPVVADQHFDRGTSISDDRN